jgi:hypothetical protein|tara:strand:+ start:2512 stop:2937 length:426 start_codon:yes stop_codon:yes gene_type:complete
MKTQYTYSDGGAKKAYPKLAKRTDNCVIRAIAHATQQSYKKVWKEMLDISSETGYFPNDLKVSVKYIEKYGFKEIKYGKSNVRMNELGHIWSKIRKNQWAILYIRRHWVAIKDNVVYDVWDSTRNSWGESPKVFRAYVKTN